MQIMNKLSESYGDDIAVVPNLGCKVANLLTDSQSSIRKLALELLVKLHSIIGDNLMVSKTLHRYTIKFK